MYELDLDILKICLRTKTIVNLLGQSFQKLDEEHYDRHTHRHTDRRDRKHYQPHWRVVTSMYSTDDVSMRRLS